MWLHPLPTAAQLHLTVSQCAQEIFEAINRHIHTHICTSKRDLRSLRSPGSPRWSVKCTVSRSEPRSEDGFGSSPEVCRSRPSHAFKSIPTAFKTKSGQELREEAVFINTVLRETLPVWDLNQQLQQLLHSSLSGSRLFSGKWQRAVEVRAGEQRVLYLAQLSPFLFLTPLSLCSQRPVEAQPKGFRYSFISGSKVSC